MINGIVLTPGKWTSLTNTHLTYEEKQENKAKALKLRQSFEKKLRVTPKTKAVNLKKESDVYAAKLQAEKEFLIRGITEGKVKSPRLLKLGAGYKKKSNG